MGDPISGSVEATNGEHQKAQLTGWAPISAEGWELRHPLSFPAEGFRLNGDSLDVLPDLANGNFAHYRLPTVQHARLHGPRGPKYCATPTDPSAVPAAERSLVGRGRSPAPRNSPERRMRERYYAKLDSEKAAHLEDAAKQNKPDVRIKAPPAPLAPIPWDTIALRW